MLRVLAWLWKIRVRVLDHRILIPMSQLSLQSWIARNLVIFRFLRTFDEILIYRLLCHDCPLRSPGGVMRRR